MHRQRRLDRDESHQWHSCGIANRHHDLHADLYWVQRFVLSSQYDGGCECRPGAGQRRVRIGEWHDGIVCTFEQPLLNGHVVERGGFGPVDMELWRFERRYQR
jgi:hypothetical protein